MLALLRRPGAFIPLLISVGFLTAFAAGIALGKLAPQPDEGAGAHLFQVLMPLQFLVIIVFAASWLPRRPLAALQVLALQLCAALAVLTVVYLRHL